MNQRVWFKWAEDNVRVFGHIIQTCLKSLVVIAIETHKSCCHRRYCPLRSTLLLAHYCRPRRCLIIRRNNWYLLSSVKSLKLVFHHRLPDLSSQPSMFHVCRHRCSVATAPSSPARSDLSLRARSYVLSSLSPRSLVGIQTCVVLLFVHLTVPVASHWSRWLQNHDIYPI